MLGDACNEILGSQLVIDYERLDRLSRSDIATESEAFSVRSKLPSTLRPMSDSAHNRAHNRIIGRDRQIFEQAVKQCAKDTDSTVYRDAFIGCLRSAGRIEVDS